MNFCTECGARSTGTAFCVECGARLGVHATDATPTEPEETLVAAPEPPAPLPGPLRIPPEEPAVWAPGQERKQSRTILIGVAVLVAAVVVGAVAAMLLERSSGDGTATTPVVKSSAPPAAPTPSASPTPDDSAATEQLNADVDESRGAAEALAGTWTAQLASGRSDGDAIDLLDKWEELHARYPGAALVWSGDWPGTFGPSHRSAWVVLSGTSEPVTEPVLQWCADEGWDVDECWARRLATSGEPEENQDIAPADERNN